MHSAIFFAFSPTVRFVLLQLPNHNYFLSKGVLFSTHRTSLFSSPPIARVYLYKVRPLVTKRQAVSVAAAIHLQNLESELYIPFLNFLTCGFIYGIATIAATAPITLPAAAPQTKLPLILNTPLIS